MSSTYQYLRYCSLDTFPQYESNILWYIISYDVAILSVKIEELYWILRVGSTGREREPLNSQVITIYLPVPRFHSRITKWAENHDNYSSANSGFGHRAPLLTGINLIPAWISNHMPSKMWDENIYPFLNFNGCTVEVWEWISNFIPHFIMDMITYPCWD